MKIKILKIIKNRKRWRSLQNTPVGSVENNKPFDKEKVKEMTFQILYSHKMFFHQDGDWMDPMIKKRPNALRLQATPLVVFMKKNITFL
jgi:hypothetical protein